MVDKYKVIESLELRPFGGKGWYTSKKVECPLCGRNDKFGIMFVKDGGLIHCFYDKFSQSIENYLKSIGRDELVDESKSVNISKKLSPLVDKKEDGAIEDMPIKKLPIGFRRIRSDPYLNNRGFCPEHYDLFSVGETRLYPQFKDYLIFQFFNEDSECIAWLARSKKSKQWHDENLKKSKEGLCGLKLRYYNSVDTNFSHLLGGLNELTSNTEIVILVEGLFDKTNVDKELGLLQGDEIKCLFTFGNKISSVQLDLLKKYSNINLFYLLYDNGTIEESKKTGLVIESELGVKIKVCEIKQKDKDPGELIHTEILTAMENSLDPLNFKIGKINGLS